MFNQLPHIPWQQLQEFIVDLINDHWLKIICGLLLAAGGAYMRRRKQRAEYLRREFLQRTNASLNYVEDGVLKIRTIFEMDLKSILFNDELIARTLKAAQLTTKEQPFLVLGDAQWLFLNSALNEMAERFAEGQMAADMGQPCVIHRYILGGTCERDGDVRTRKIRIMIARADFLDKINAGGFENRPHFEATHHHVRWKTLLKMAELYGNGSKLLISMNITVRDMRPAQPSRTASNGTAATSHT